MPRVCTICFHPEREAIESAIVTGTSKRDISLQFGVGHMAVQRHATHITDAIREAKQGQTLQSGSTALDRMAKGEKIVDEILSSAWGEKNKEPDLALKTLAELRRQVELRAKIEGELDEHTITITSIPEWRELRALLLEALSTHPQAKMAVIRALEAYSHEQSA